MSIPPRVMIVDDNESDVELLKAALEDLDQPATLAIARNGAQAIAQIAACLVGHDHPRLVLLDLNMPAVSGHEVLAFIRSHAVLSDMRVVILTTSMLPADRVRCMVAGANDYRVKPQRFADYLVLIQSLFATHVEVDHA